MPENTSGSRIDEASDSLNTGRFYFLLLFVSLIGVIGALMMIVFVFLQDSLTALLWNDIPVDSLSPGVQSPDHGYLRCRGTGCRSNQALFQG